jgi:BlaR1 peptidase M56
VNRARRFYRVSLAVGALATSVLGFALLSALRLVNPQLPTLHSALKACRAVTLSGQTAISLGVLTLTGVCLAVLILAVRSAVRHYRAQQLALENLHVQYNAVYRGVGLTVFTDEHPDAFSAGLLKPRVYLSSGALQTLQPGELAAVTEHEFHHCERRDPLRMLIVHVLSDALFFLPVMRRMRERYRTLAELAADEAAVSKGACPGTLAAAMIAFAEGSRPGVVGIAPERVDHLLGTTRRWNLPVVMLAGTLVTLAALFTVAMGLALTVVPAGMSLAGMTAQLCMVLMLLVPGACANATDVVPVLLGVGAVAFAYRRRRRLAGGTALLG